MKRQKVVTTCPCGRLQQGRPQAFADCCGLYIGQPTPAPDAEALMRSRYSAFVRQDADYLLATWEAGQRPAQLDFEPGLQWLGLEVKDFRATGPDSAEVEFVARYRLGGRAVRLHERSRFVRQNGCWLYLDGEQF